MGKFENNIIQLTEEILGLKANNQKTFEWLINSHLIVEDDIIKDVLNTIFVNLKGDFDCLRNKRKCKLRTDAYFDSLKLVLEIDELQHFTLSRLQTLEIIQGAKNIRLGYDIESYINKCKDNHILALKKGQVGYRKPTKEFPFKHGRAYQRAYFDSIRDLVIPQYLHKPVLRISEIDINKLNSEEEIKKYIDKRLQDIL
ncbi:hypothetical protein [Vallitalea guaymasensis]|uniref:hypothetical protein n=1 Tax=Vallitalea guaymasensis TaxID=1185412 RepID=UPI002729E350|nr:hypothetical protein [Vallitalea guaymasensis]